MTINTGAYVGAKSCTSGPQPGAWGAMDYFLSAYKSKGGVNTGIYNCRSVRGGRTTSLHGEGRAADFGIRPYSAGYGTALARALVAYSKELGIQCVIWNRGIWSSSYPHSGFRRYSGVASHTDHIHVEFTWARAKAGRAETAKHFAKVLGGVKPGDVKIGGGGSSSPTYKTVSGSTPLVKLYHKGEPVKRIQKAVGVKADSYYGPSTVAAVKKWQKANGLAADGIFGDKSWGVLNGGKAKKPKKSSSSAPKFPLPKGSYFGPKSGPNSSVSGYYNNREHLRTWQKQMRKRGWTLKADGLYGSRTKAVALNFQKEKGLKGIDSLIGPETWAAAWEEPVT